MFLGPVALRTLAASLALLVVAAVWGMVRPHGASSETVTALAPVVAPAPSPSSSTPPMSSPAPSVVEASTAAGAAVAGDITGGGPEGEFSSTSVSEAEAADAPVSAVSSGGLTAADRAAGLRSTAVPQRGPGTLVVVPGGANAPGKGKVYRVRVEIEKNLNVDGQAVAATVMATLNDSRSWGHGGRMTFARTSGKADIRVVLATPQTSAKMCAPLVTLGKVSCAQGNAAILTYFRWVTGTPDYGADRTGYRRYLVNHEVGHVLGHHHEYCPGKGKRAPVMMQQTKGLLGCVKNSWPFP